MNVRLEKQVDHTIIFVIKEFRPLSFIKYIWNVAKLQKEVGESQEGKNRREKSYRLLFRKELHE